MKRKIEGHSHLQKNETGAVVLADKKLYQRAKAKKAEREKMANIENRMDRIESLLIKLIEDKDK